MGKNVKKKYDFLCPVCGKTKFYYLKEEKNRAKSYKIDNEHKRLIELSWLESLGIGCDYCGWRYDPDQVKNHDIKTKLNKYTVNEQKTIYYEAIAINPKYKFRKEVYNMDKGHMCPICGEYKFKKTGEFEMCKICGWEDDGSDDFFMNDYVGMNGVTIEEAKNEFKKKRELNPKYKYINELRKEERIEKNKNK